VSSGNFIYMNNIGNNILLNIDILYYNAYTRNYLLTKQYYFTLKAFCYIQIDSGDMYQKKYIYYN